MIRRRALSLFLGTLAATSALHAGPGCGGGGAAPDLSDVVYEGEATDEALVSLLDKTPTDVAAHRAVFDTPANGAVLASGAPLTWHDPAAAASVDLAPSSGEPRRRDVGRGWLEPLRDLVGPMKSAYAHGAPLDGPAYLLELSSEGTRLYRVFTTDTTHTPDATHFAKLKGKTVKVCVTGAIFEQNEVAADGGPYIGSCVTVTAS